MPNLMKKLRMNSSLCSCDALAAPTLAVLCSSAVKNKSVIVSISSPPFNVTEALTHNVELFLSLLNQAVVVAQVRVLVIDALCIDVVSDFAELRNIFVTEIGFCS